MAALAAGILCAACAGTTTSPTPVTSPTSLTLRMETAGFRVFTDSAPDGVLRGVADRLEGQRPRVMADLGVAAVRPMTVKVWQDPAAWAAEVQRVFGRSIDTAGYVTGPDELRVLAGPAVERNATHEMSHCVSLYLNPGFANNPRWLWESVALYENGELVDPRTLDYMVAGRPPSLQELDADVSASHRVYDVGYLVGEFVVSRAGRAGLVALIRANGDTQAVLDLSTAEFEAAWYEYVRDKYLAGADPPRASGS